MASQLSNGLSSYVIIPARASSTRLPRKLLLRDTGKSVLQHTYEAALNAARPFGVCVAAGDEEIAKEVLRFGGQVERTSGDFQSGTDRVAFVARQPRLAGIDIIVNLQGDEPEVSGDAIDRVIELLQQDSQAVMATLATPVTDDRQMLDPAAVKVVCDDRGRALYFSRAPIPYRRSAEELSDASESASPLLHVGLYAYRRDFLLKLASLPRTPLERIESLEQLRVLESGYRIAVGVVDEATCGIDTDADYQAFVRRQRSA